MEFNPLHGQVPELKQGRFRGESKGTNSACGFPSRARFAHAACHYFNAGTVSTQGLCLVLRIAVILSTSFGANVQLIGRDLLISCALCVLICSYKVGDTE